MIITDDKKLWDVQREFHEMFSHLRIEFYEGKHDTGEGSPVKDKLDGGLRLGNVRKLHTEGDFEVTGNTTVADFEQQFFDKYGLNVQVFRKSGNLWMQTTSTDHWTLNEQNRKGGSSEQHFKEKYKI